MKKPLKKKKSRQKLKAQQARAAKARAAKRGIKGSAERTRAGEPLPGSIRQKLRESTMLTEAARSAKTPEEHQRYGELKLAQIQDFLNTSMDAPPKPEEC